MRHVYKYLLTILCVGNMLNVSAQRDSKSGFVLKDRFISSAGIFFAQPAKASKSNNYAGVSFSPQLNLLNSFSDFSIALATQADIGYNVSPDSGDSKFMTSIPIVMTLNAGHLASRDFY